MKKIPILTTIILWCLCSMLSAQTVHTGPNDWAGGFSYARDNNTKIPLDTRFNVDFDAKNLYITVECKGPGMDQLRKQPPGKNMQWPGGDSIEIFLDPGRTCGKYFQIAVGANGAKYDSRSKKVWKDLYTASVKMFDDQWTVRVTIPFDSPGMQKPHIGDRWGFNICRNVKTGGDYFSTWAKVGANFHNPAKFGTLIIGSKADAQRGMQKKNMEDMVLLEHDLQKRGLYSNFEKQIKNLKQNGFTQLDLRDIREEAAVDEMLEKIK